MASPKEKEFLLREIDIMKKLNHPNIIKCYETFLLNGNYFLVLQYCNDGDLEKFMDKTCLTGLDHGLAVHFFKQIILGFQELNAK